jgi:hypothetical protein
VEKIHDHGKTKYLSTFPRSPRKIYTGLLEELEYLKIETRLIDEKFASVRGECVI